MKLKRKSPFGGKRIADKVRQAFKHMPRESREAVGREIADEVRRATESVGGTDSGLPDVDLRDLQSTLMGIHAIQVVLSSFEGAPGVDALIQAIEANEDEYMPGGPPMSPVHDSLWVAWSNLDLCVGRHKECAADIVSAVLPLFSVDPFVAKAIDHVKDSRLGIYEVLAALERKVGDGARYRLRELVTKREIVVQFFQEYEPISERNLLLLRELPALEHQRQARGVTHLTIGTPYLMPNVNALEMKDYFERESARIFKSRLTSETYEAIMRGAGDPPRWLEYVMVGYAGVDDFGVVTLVGIPDQPETLPHHREFDRRSAETVPPRAPAKERSQVLSKRLSSRYRSLMSHAGSKVKQRLGRFEPLIVERGGSFDLWAPFLMPIALYRHAPGGPPFTEYAERVLEVDDDLREWIAAGRQGRVSVYEVVDVEPGVRMTLRDVFDGEEVVVEERSATTDMPTRSILLAMPIPYRGIWLLEGLYGRPLFPAAKAAVLDKFAKLRATDGLGLDLDRLEEIVTTYQALETATLDERRRELARDIATTTGERVRPTQTVFALGANRRSEVFHAVSRLRRCELVSSEGDREGEERVDEFVVLTASGVVEAQLVLEEQTLEIKTLAPERTRKVVTRIRNKLPELLEKLTESTDDLSTAEAVRDSPPRERQPPSAEELAVLRQFFATRYVSFLDEPLPALEGKTPRQAARSPALRDRLDELLRQHEYGVTRQVGVGVVDFAKMRRTLGLTD